MKILFILIIIIIIIVIIFLLDKLLNNIFNIFYNCDEKHEGIIFNEKTKELEVDNSDINIF